MQTQSRFTSRLVATLLLASMGACIGQAAQARTVVITQDGFTKGGTATLTLDLPDAFDYTKERDWTWAIEHATLAFSGSSLLPSFRQEWNEPGGVEVIIEGLSEGVSTIGDQMGEGLYVVTRGDTQFGVAGFRGESQPEWSSQLFAVIAGPNGGVGVNDASTAFASVSAVPEASALSYSALGMAGLLGLALRKRAGRHGLGQQAAS